MKIERIDEKTVKCFLSNEELEEYDIDYKDFILRSDKAREVVQDIMEKAEIEVGYKPPKFAFDLQIMMLPDQGMVLTFSEKDPVDALSGEQIVEYLKDMKQILQRAKEKIATEGNVTQTKATDEQMDDGKKAKEKKQPPLQPCRAVFAFDRMSSLIDYAKVLPANLRVKSALFDLNGKLYLYMEKGTASYARYSRACIQAMEFGKLYTAAEDRIRHVKEHGQIVIAEQALKKLKL